MNNMKSDSKPCATDPANDTELSNLVDKLEMQSSLIMELRYRIEYILARLTGPIQESPTAEYETPCGSIRRLQHSYDRNTESINDLEDSISQLEKVV